MYLAVRKLLGWDVPLLILFLYSYYIIKPVLGKGYNLFRNSELHGAISRWFYFWFTRKHALRGNVRADSTSITGSKEQLLVLAGSH